MTERVWVSIGSNIQPAERVRAAVRELRAQFGQLNISPVYQTPATGFAGDDFYNLVAGFDTSESLPELRARLRQIEAEQGRVRTADKFSARTLDIDVILYGEQVTRVAGKPIPSPEIMDYPFVLKPLVDVIPEAKHPEQQISYQQLWEQFAGEKLSLQQIPFTFE